ncbi:MAG: GNAT family N-acetyltransferase [Nocardioides sp.]
MSPIIITAAHPKDTASARRFSVETGMFEHEESVEVEQQLLAVIHGHDPGTVLTAKNGDEVVGAGYVAPEPCSDRCWNLYFLVVDRDQHGLGIGTLIVAEVEQRLRDLGPTRARVLLIETSSTDQYVNTRAFYKARGYTQEATVRYYYGPGDHKVIFWKQLQT